MSGNGKRKWSAEEKLRIVLAEMQPGVEVSDLCRREGLSPNLYYLWKTQLLSSAPKIFKAKSGRPSAAEQRSSAASGEPPGHVPPGLSSQTPGPARRRRSTRTALSPVGGVVTVSSGRSVAADQVGLLGQCDPRCDRMADINTP